MGFLNGKKKVWMLGVAILFIFYWISELPNMLAGEESLIEHAFDLIVALVFYGGFRRANARGGAEAQQEPQEQPEQPEPEEQPEPHGTPAEPSTGKVCPACGAPMTGSVCDYCGTRTE